MSYGLLKGKRGIIFGALNEKSIAWKVAQRCHEEGATLALSNTAAALRFGTLDKLAEETGSIVIPADATSVEELERVFTEAMEQLGMSPNIRKRIPYEDLNYKNYEKTLDISAVSFHKMLSVAKRLDAISEWGSVVALTYIAAQRSFVDYSDMADAKAMLESITRSFGLIYGEARHVRINTISQSPTATTAGEGIEGMEQLRLFADRMSPLGNADADDCADYCVALFSDLTRKVTMQNLYHDGGFSSVGITRSALEQFFS